MLLVAMDVQQTRKPFINTGCFIPWQTEVTADDKPIVASLSDHRQQISELIKKLWLGT
jgi:hypothetical protein